MLLKVGFIPLMVLPHLRSALLVYYPNGCTTLIQTDIRTDTYLCLRLLTGIRARTLPGINHSPLRLCHSAYNTMHMITWISCLHCINPLIKPIPPPPPPYTHSTWIVATLVYCFLSMAQLVHDAPLIRIDASLLTLCGLVRNRYLLPGTQVLESSITSSCTIPNSYRLCPISFLSMQESVFWLLGTVVQCGVPIYVQLGSFSMALEIPVASMLGTPRYFTPKPHAINWEPQFVADHINGPNTKSYRRTMEPCTTTKTTTIIGRRLTSEQYQLETNG